MAAYKIPEDAPAAAGRVRTEAVGRLEKDVAMYQREIEELQARIKDETEELQMRHLNRLLLETQRALADVLTKVDEYRD